MSTNFKVFFVFLIYFNQISFAQNSVEFSQLEGENVSTQSITYAIKEDNLGNLWIGSEEGILKHNSKYYKVYNTYNGIPESLSNRTSEIFIDSKNNIWAGLERGVCLYNKFLDKFEIIKSKDNINPSLVKSIDEDNEGNIWIAGFNGLWMYNPLTKELGKTKEDRPIEVLFIKGDQIFLGTREGLFSYNKNSKTSTKHFQSKKSLNVYFINEVNNKLFVGTKSGLLYAFDFVNNKLSYSEPIKNFNNSIRDILQDNDGVFVATDGDGIYKLNNKFKIINHFFQDVNNPNSISSNGTYDLELSKEGILWVATYGGGISYYNINKLPFYKIQHQLNNENSLSNNFTRSIKKDSNGSFWFGTKEGLSIWNPKKNSWKHIKNFIGNDTSQIIVLALEQDKDFMWIGTYNYGLFKININTFKIINYNSLHPDKDIIDKIYAIKKDRNSNIWVGGIDKGLIMISPENDIVKYPILNIKNITETFNGLILASGRNGVYEINPENKNFRIIEDLEPSKKSLEYSSINALQETKSKNLILGTNGAGLIFYDRLTNKIKKFNMNSGLPSDIVQGVILDSNDFIWASTTKGLVNIKIKNNDTLIDIYDKKDGLASTEYNYGSFSKLDKNLFAFGGVDGVTFFNPKEIIAKNYKPNLVFEEFKLSNKVVKPSEKPLDKHINETQKIVLKSNENSIEIKFTGIQHTTSNKMKYSWILEGFENDWSKPSANNFATYTNLESGKYTFKVIAINKYNNESNQRVIGLTVLSPWWNTTLAFVVYVILLIILIVGIIHFSTVIIKKKNADDQIEFFNNITHEIKTPLTILMSSLENVTNENKEGESNRQIKATVKRLTSLFEQMLNFHKVTSQDTIYQNVSKIKVNKYLEARVKNFKPLTEERDIIIKIENNWPQDIFYYYKDVFDKITLNLLSNAIKYSYDKGVIKIKLDLTNKGELKLQIIDNGFGIPKDQQEFILKRYYRARNAINSQKPGTGLGLIMTKKLIEKTGGSISFKSIENKGTTFTVLLKNLNDLYKESAIDNVEYIKKEQEAEDQLELDRFSDAKILIVEDNDELRSILVETLGNYFLIFEANNGKEGLESASQNFPDIILTDLIMPEMDGMEMAKKIKTDINLNHIPVFMLTVLQNSTQKLESIESGVSEYLEKPVDFKLLLAKIVNTLKFQRKLREKYVHDNDSENAILFRTQKDQDFLSDLENKVIENIENNSFSVHDLSHSFGMSRTSLYMKLKNLVDLSPQDFIIHTKLKHAKNLLIKGHLSIKEVAYSSGFSNPKYFSTSFKKFYKVTPSGFLNSLKQE